MDIAERRKTTPWASMWQSNGDMGGDNIATTRLDQTALVCVGLVQIPEFHPNSLQQVTSF